MIWSGINWTSFGPWAFFLYGPYCIQLFLRIVMTQLEGEAEFRIWKDMGVIGLLQHPVDDSKKAFTWHVSMPPCS